jgi:hypothetical protein
MPPVGQHHLYAPVALDIPAACFPGPLEQEDNDHSPTANGPLCAPGAFFGFPDDQEDYFFFNTTVSGPIAVTVTGHQGQGVQLQLYYNSVSGEPVAEDPGQADGLSVSLPVGGPGRYYILIYTETPKPGATQPYAMTAAFP